MKVIITAQREILLDVQGSNVWSGQQVQVRSIWPPHTCGGRY